MQTGVQVLESGLSPPCKQVEHHGPARGEGDVARVCTFFPALLKPFPHIPFPQQRSSTLMAREPPPEKGQAGGAPLIFLLLVATRATRI